MKRIDEEHQMLVGQMISCADGEWRRTEEEKLDETMAIRLRSGIRKGFKEVVSKMEQNKLKRAARKYTATNGVGGDGFHQRTPFRSFERNSERNGQDSPESQAAWEMDSKLARRFF